jgi:hypothetical protein
MLIYPEAAAEPAAGIRTEAAEADTINADII